MQDCVEGGDGIKAKLAMVVRAGDQYRSVGGENDGMNGAAGYLTDPRDDGDDCPSVGRKRVAQSQLSAVIFAYYVKMTANGEAGGVIRTSCNEE